MKILALALSAILFCVPAWAKITVTPRGAAILKPASSGGSANYALSGMGSVTVGTTGSTLVVFLATDGGGVGSGTPPVSVRWGSNVMTANTYDDTDPNRSFGVFTLENATAGTAAITIDDSGGEVSVAQFWGACAFEVVGAISVSPFDDGAGSSGTSANPASRTVSAHYDNGYMVSLLFRESGTFSGTLSTYAVSGDTASANGGGYGVQSIWMPAAVSGSTYTITKTGTNSAAYVWMNAIIKEATTVQAAMPSMALVAVSISGSGANWSGSQTCWPLLGIYGTPIDTLVVRNYSRFDYVLLGGGYASDSTGLYGRLLWNKAIRDIRAINPNVKILGYGVIASAYRRTGTEAPTYGNATLGDSTSTYNSVYLLWRAVRIAGGGMSGSCGAESAFSRVLPGDSTGGRGFLWNKMPGGKGFYFGQYGMSGGNVAATPGYIWNNVNLAWRNGSDWPVRDSVVNVVTRQYVLRRDELGAYVYDGLTLDLLFLSPWGGGNVRDSVDFTRAGYSSHAAFDSAYYTAATTALAMLRANAANAGRTDFIITVNGGGIHTVPAANGWVAEFWPSQQGGTWRSNFSSETSVKTRYPASGNVVGLAAVQHRRNKTWPFGAEWSPAVNRAAYVGAGHADSATGTMTASGTSGWPGGVDISADTIAFVRNHASYAAATAALTDGLVYYSAGENPQRADRWWFDEQAVDTTTGLAVKDRAYSKWLGSPLGSWRNHAPDALTNQTDLLGGYGDFTAGAHQTSWTISADSPTNNTLSFVSDTSVSGVAAKVQVKLTDPSSTMPYGTQLLCGVVLLDTLAKERQVTFWARASTPRPIRVLLYTRRSGIGSAGQTDVSKWKVQPVWVDSGAFKPYSMPCTIDTSGSKLGTDTVRTQLRFWFGDTTGTVWIDNVTIAPLQRGGSYVRDFEHGVAVVNPNYWIDTLTVWRPLMRIKSRTVSSTTNTGMRYSVGTKIIVPAWTGLLLPVGGWGPGDIPSGGQSSSSGKQRSSTRARARGR